MASWRGMKLGIGVIVVKVVFFVIMGILTDVTSAGTLRLIGAVGITMAGAASRGVVSYIGGEGVCGRRFW